MKYLFLLSLIMSIALCHIVELSDSNFKQEVEDTQTMWLVVFTAQWCDHCKHLKPQLEKAAEILLKWGVSVGIVGENNPKLVNQFVVDPKTHMVSYPKLFLFLGPQVLEEVPSSIRTAPQITSWISNSFGVGKEMEDL